MLDLETKRKINNARDILVGKVPDPKSQVEQITIALIYKFMDDMDKESVGWGGKPTFFSGEYEKYAWSKIFDPKTGGHELIKLYQEAIEKLNHNPNIPQLFRDIFKNAYLPYRDPETLKMFLKEINEFTYDHSERLGDAFEYLLSVLSSQGAAGQFRTPRHIIDFIVAVVSPRKAETILDPACGTAGFLISAYKHILQTNGQDRPGDQLDSDEQRRLLTNFTGYDISPDMIRLALVNMYLHGFPNPQIHEYDTLSSENRWDETFDVILANPPFMTPKGGIRPHKRFSIQANRSEVLFVDYIAEHLNPGGRAGVIVPEGIIFQSSNAYKALRKMLVENYLWAVVSLPAGIFQPYSGVKTSVLLMDKAKAKQSDSILFVKVDNDGFDLGAQRRAIDKNDLTQALQVLKSGDADGSELAHFVEKSRIAESGDWNLSGERYRESEYFRSSKYDKIEIGEVCDIFNGSTPSRKDVSYWENGTIPWFTIDDIRKQGRVISYTKQQITKKALIETSVKLLPKNTVLLCCTASVGEFAYSNIELTTNQQFNGLVVKYEYFNRLLPQFLFSISSTFKKELIRLSGKTSFNFVSVGTLKKVQIPLPPLSVQEEIVAEVNSYQKIIDGARQVVNNWKPTIKIDPGWEMVEIGNYFKNTKLGLVKSKKEQDPKYKCPYIKMDCITDNGQLDLEKCVSVNSNKEEFESFTLTDGDFIYNTRNAPNLVGKCSVYHGPNGKYLFNNNILSIQFTKELNPDYANYYLNSKAGKHKIRVLVSGTTSVAAIYQKNFATITLPVPDINIQQKIVARIKSEQEMVNANKKLITIYEQKIKDKIAEVWGE
ncbi:MAG: N-6 DNA methylase [Candidatus Marinimicrobia bacterium]|nr:N-6 DNA methylase [Candidatus Neomarinimicrobiota bacterium]